MWSGYCHNLLTDLSSRPSKALSSISSSVPTIAIPILLIIIILVYRAVHSTL